MTLLHASAIIMVATALAHSVMGEKRLIAPLLARNIDLLAGYRAALMRFAWHYTSVLMIVTAALVAWPDAPVLLIQITGAAWLFAGVFDAIVTRGKHIGWPLLSLAGILALMGAGA